MKELERAGLGELEVNDMQRGTNSVRNTIKHFIEYNSFMILHCIIMQTYTFKKKQVTEENMEDMSTKLMPFSVTLAQYQSAYQQPEIQTT